MNLEEASKVLVGMVASAMGTFEDTDICAMWNDGEHPVPIGKWGDFRAAAWAVRREAGVMYRWDSKQARKIRDYPSNLLSRFAVWWLERRKRAMWRDYE
jgi:uncharacterized protein YbaA (DUF1428 family)